jgi:hypothetical protein
MKYYSLHGFTIYSDSRSHFSQVFFYKLAHLSIGVLDTLSSGGDDTPSKYKGTKRYLKALLYLFIR